MSNVKGTEQFTEPLRLISLNLRPARHTTFAGRINALAVYLARTLVHTISVSLTHIYTLAHRVTLAIVNNNPLVDFNRRI